MPQFEVRILDVSKNVSVQIDKADGEYRSHVKALEAGREVAAQCFETPIDDLRIGIETEAGQQFVYSAAKDGTYAPIDVLRRA